jgi:hypothetical protein
MQRGDGTSTLSNFGRKWNNFIACLSGGCTEVWYLSGQNHYETLIRSTVAAIKIIHVCWYVAANDRYVLVVTDGAPYFEWIDTKPYGNFRITGGTGEVTVECQIVPDIGRTVVIAAVEQHMWCSGG